METNTTYSFNPNYQDFEKDLTSQDALGGVEKRYYQILSKKPEETPEKAGTSLMDLVRFIGKMALSVFSTFPLIFVRFNSQTTESQAIKSNDLADRNVSLRKQWTREAKAYLAQEKDTAIGKLVVDVMRNPLFIDTAEIKQKLWEEEVKNRVGSNVTNYQDAQNGENSQTIKEEMKSALTEYFNKFYKTLGSDDLQRLKTLNLFKQTLTNYMKSKVEVMDKEGTVLKGTLLTPDSNSSTSLRYSTTEKTLNLDFQQLARNTSTFQAVAKVPFTFMADLTNKTVSYKATIEPIVLKQPHSS